MRMLVRKLPYVVIVFIIYLSFIQMLPALFVGLRKCEKLNTRFFKMSQDMCLAVPSDIEVLQKIKNFIPPLTYNQHKGQAGRIGVIGGCKEYTGAPYFAAISALKLGADLAHVFCTRSAASVIKSYSPELIVHPILDKEGARREMQQWIPRLHAVVIGPGLGRDPNILKAVEGIMDDLKANKKPLVIDADGLYMVTHNINLVRGYKNTIITPNAVEFQRLSDALRITTSDQTDADRVVSMSQALGGVIVARKHKLDVISDSKTVLQVTATGSPRRCGGQGDLLSGAAAVFFHWALTHESVDAQMFTDVGPGVLSAYAACLLSKFSAEAAFSKMGRSTTTTDLITEIHPIFENHFEPPHKKFM